MYYYINKQGKGMKSNGTFTKDRKKWITFDQDFKTRMETNNQRPYGATYPGAFIEINKY